MTKKLSLSDAELLAEQFRNKVGISRAEPVNVKTIIRRLGILTMYRPLSEKSFGISIKAENSMFMLVNSNTTRGRQHFTIAHELYHLFYDSEPEPHICSNVATGVEKEANMFAAALLMPREGLLKEITPLEMRNHKVDMATILKIEQLFGVSRLALLLRLKEIGAITESVFYELSSVKAKDTAREYGYDTSLYEAGNEGLVIGDLGVKAKRLFDENKISEGHYMELLSLIYYDREEN